MHPLPLLAPFFKQIKQAQTLNYSYPDNLLEKIQSFRPNLFQSCVLIVFNEITCNELLSRPKIKANANEIPNPDLNPIVNTLECIEILLIQKAIDHSRHSGQMAFPGGFQKVNESKIKCAFREAQEELNLPPDKVQLKGLLPPLTTLSGFRISPYLAQLKCPKNRILLKARPEEVAQWRWLSFKSLLEVRELETRTLENNTFALPLFNTPPVPIWGATALMLDLLLNELTTFLNLQLNHKTINRTPN